MDTKTNKPQSDPNKGMVVNINDIYITDEINNAKDEYCAYQPKSNTVYTITNNGKFDIGYLYKYDCHLSEVMTYGASYTKQYCKSLQDGLMEGYNEDIDNCDTYDEANINRQLFHLFLIKYRSGDFKYRRTTRSKYAYFYELPKQVQRNINRVIDTLNEIYDID